MTVRILAGKGINFSIAVGLIRLHTWSETFFQQDLFPSYSHFRRQFHAIVNFRLKSSSDIDSGSLPRVYSEFIYAKLKIVLS